MILSEVTYSCGAEQEVNKLQQEADSKLKESNSLCVGLFSAHERLERLKDSCANSGWDGEDAQAVSQVSYDNAKSWLLRMPAGIEAPDPGVNVRGQITLEWRRDDGRLLSLAFDDQGEVHYIVFLRFEKFYSNMHASLGYTEKLRNFLEDIVSN